MQKAFIQAIKDKRKVQVTFFSKEDGRDLCRVCAPMDFGPSRIAKDKSDRFHLWDYESDTKKHTLSLLPKQVKEINVLNQSFEPSEFVSWTPNWFVARDWGKYS